MLLSVHYIFSQYEHGENFNEAQTLGHRISGEIPKLNQVGCIVRTTAAYHGKTKTLDVISLSSM